MSTSDEKMANMKVVLLEGGFGMRISEETAVKPKPRVEIGGKPILWHIMKLYSQYGLNDFIICLGHKSEVIKDYFSHYFVSQSDVTYDYWDNNREMIHQYKGEPWTVTLVYTGHNTMTGGRVKRIAPYIGDQPFLLTYGDGLSDVNIRELVDFHVLHGRSATVTTVQPAGRFGFIQLGVDSQVRTFLEKPKGDGGWINDGFFAMEPSVVDYIAGDDTVLEKEPLERLAEDGQLMAFRHEGFWKPMDTPRDMQELERLCNSSKAPWMTCLP